MEPDVDLATHIASQLAWLSLATNWFYGTMPPDPDECGAVIAYGGPAPERLKNGTEAMRISPLQIRWRSPANDPEQGRDRIRAIRDVVYDAGWHVDFAAYTDIRLLQQEPMYLGPDERGRHNYSLNCEASYRE